MKRFVVLLPILFLSLCPLVAAQNRTYTIEDLLKVRRVGDPQISPDGKRVAFTIGDVNYGDNRIVTQIYTTSLEGGSIKQLTSGDSSSSSPRWSPDGQWIAYTMEEFGEVMLLRTNGSVLHRVPGHGLYPGITWSPDSRFILGVEDTPTIVDITTDVMVDLPLPWYFTFPAWRR